MSSTRYDEIVRSVEKMIVDALPEIATKLISMAKDGSTVAAGHVAATSATAKTPP